MDDGSGDNDDAAGDEVVCSGHQHCYCISSSGVGCGMIPEN